MSPTFVQFVLAPLVTACVTAGATIFAVWYRNKLAQESTPDLADPNFEDLLRPVLDIIQETTGAQRVQFWEGKNGTNTLSGYHMKTLNLMVESNVPELEDVKFELQDLSVETFRRNMRALSSSESGYLLSHESDHNDELAAFHAVYDTKTVIYFKIITKFSKWTAIVQVCFSEERKQFSDEDLAWMSAQVGRIGSILRR